MTEICRSGATGPPEAELAPAAFMKRPHHSTASCNADLHAISLPGPGHQGEAGAEAEGRHCGSPLRAQAASECPLTSGVAFILVRCQSWLPFHEPTSVWASSALPRLRILCMHTTCACNYGICDGGTIRLCGTSLILFPALIHPHLVQQACADWPRSWRPVTLPCFDASHG